MKKIVLTGGGTAGHVTPNLALIPRLKADGWEIHYIGAANSAEEALITQVEGVSFHTVSVGKLRRYFDPKNFSDPFRSMAFARRPDSSTISSPTWCSPRAASYRSPWSTGRS